MSFDLKIKPYKPPFFPYNPVTNTVKSYPEDYFDDDPTVQLINGTPKPVDAGSGTTGGVSHPGLFRLSDKGSVCPLGDKQCLTRVKIYAYEIYGIASAKFTMAKLKSAAKNHLKINKSIPFYEKQSNFTIFETMCLNKIDPWGDPLMEVFKKGTSAYNELKIYSETDYGSLMIERVINSSLSFTVYSAPGKQAMANTSYMRLPPNFPAVDAYPFSNQQIDPQATIHHEFEHTQYGTKSYNIGSLIEEVAAVVEHENPARIIDGFEPRYVYYQAMTKTTVSIFDFNVTLPGGRSFDLNDPRILI